MTHICVGKLAIFGSDNGLWPERHEAIIWTKVGILLIRPLETNFSEILIEIYTFSFKKMHLKMASAKWRPFCPGLNVLTAIVWTTIPAPSHPGQVTTTHLKVNSLWPSDTIWRHSSGSPLAQVMACCLTAPSHYLHQCWLTISKVHFIQLRVRYTYSINHYS